MKYKAFTPDGISCTVDLDSVQQYIRVRGRGVKQVMVRLKAWREARGFVTQEFKSK